MKVLCATLLIAIALAVPAPVSAVQAWKDKFQIDKADLASSGANPYFILKPGYQLYFKSEDGDLTITVLNDTKIVDGVQTRVVEERETEGGKLIEVSRNYFAISKKTRDVFYFGEDVDMYKNGKVIGHGGSWHAGVNGAKAGLMMPGTPVVGARFYQEVAPKTAMDRAEIVSLSETLRIPAGVFLDNVLQTEETTPLEPGTKEYKYYVAGVGLLKDGGMKLIRHGYAK